MYMYMYVHHVQSVGSGCYNEASDDIKERGGGSLYSSAASDQLLLDLSPRQTPPTLHWRKPAEEEGEEEEGEGGGGGEMKEGRGRDWGLAVVDFSHLHLFVVSQYRGDRNHDYVCAYVSLSDHLWCPSIGG